MPIEIIPAIDIIDGRCVRLTQGDYGRKKIYNENPIEVAKQFEDAGLRRLHLVDLDGAKAGKVRNWKVLETIATGTGLVIDFGGGVASVEDLEKVFDSGAAFCTVGSIAVKEEDKFMEWLKDYGPEKFLLGADVRSGKIAISGWQVDTEIWLPDFIRKFMNAGIRRIFCTDINLDGAMQGPAVNMYQTITDQFPDLYFIASGGVRSLDDILHLELAGCSGVILGKAIYEGTVTLEELVRFV